MNKTIIHIGLPKTATTFFQNCVWPFVRGYTYLSRPYTQHNHAFNQLHYADDTLYKKDLLIEELKQIHASRLLISDESFSGKTVFFSYLNRTMIAKRLKEVFPKAEIILFLRDQRDMILSQYSSYITMPYGTKRIEDLFYKPRRNYVYTDYLSKPTQYDMQSLYYNTNDYFIHLDCFLYLPFVDLYRNLFDKCHVFLYEDFVRDRASTVSRLEEIVGEPIKIKSSTPRNVSLTYSQLERRRKANQVSPIITNKYARKLIQIAMNVFPGTPGDLKETVNKIVGDYYVKDNKALKDCLPHLPWDRHSGKYI